MGIEAGETGEPLKKPRHLRRTMLWSVAAD
jgi:hypothetical protein